MEEEAAGGAEGSPAVSSESHLPQNSQQTGTFAEDLDASSTELDPVVPNGWAVPQATKPLTKLKPTYNMPLSKFADVGLSSDSESASETKLGHTMSPFTATSRNPFSVAGTSSPHTIMPAGVFSFRAHLPEAPSRMPGTPSIKSGHQPASRKLTDTRTARRSNTVFVSDGMGGSRSQHAARKTTTQAKITWGPRKA
ncbi:hypothetical protein EC988_004491 [Linderina pennispora]|nr:hypothetical protein EC988_004491 [Linderina pennispora]